MVFVRVFVVRLRVFFMDEFFFVFDFKMCEKFCFFVRNVIDEYGMMVFYVIYDFEDVFVLVKYVVVMRDGRIV